MTEIAEVSGEGTVDKLVYRRGVSVRPYGLVILLLLIFPTPSQAQIRWMSPSSARFICFMSR